MPNKHPQLRQPLSQLPQLLSWVHSDPRHYQLIMLITLVILGITLFELPITFTHIGLTTTMACTVDMLGQHFIKKQPIDCRSALITSGSLCLLLRVSHPLWMMAASVIAIGSKYVLRCNQRHIFNPANIAITTLILCTGQAWLSPGQWGHTLLIMGLIWAMGGWIIFRAQRSDITLSFLVTYIMLLLARSMWLGDPLSIPLHQLQSGALLIFAFLMISDPKTTPLNPIHRIGFGACIAVLTVIIQWNFYRPDALMLALTLGSFIVPILNHGSLKTNSISFSYPQPQGVSLS